MASFNKVILIGNLVADPELKKTPNDVSVVSVRLAVSRKYRSADGTTPTDFIDVVCWRSTAEFVAKYFTKGSPMLVCGSLQQRSWTDQNGAKRYTIEVVADEISFVERKSQSQGAGRDNGVYYGEPPAAPGMGTHSAANAAPAANFEDVPTEDDLPF